MEVGPEEYEARMKIGVAAIRGTYQGRVKIVEKDEPNSYRMAVEGKGPAGQISGDAKIDLEDGEEPSSTGRATPMCAALWLASAAA